MVAKQHLANINFILNKQTVMFHHCDPIVRQWFFDNEVKAELMTLNEGNWIKSKAYTDLTRVQQLQVFINIIINMLKTNFEQVEQRLSNGDYLPGQLQNQLDKLLAISTNSQGDILLNHIEPVSEDDLDPTSMEKSLKKGSIAFSHAYCIRYLSTLTHAIKSLDTQLIKESRGL